MRLEENIPLAPLTTFRVGGPARFFVEAKSVGDVQEAVAFARSQDVPLFILGGGSNLVVADSGWPGLVVKIAIQGIERRPGHTDEGKVLFDVGAGEPWDRFVSHAVMAKCAGVSPRQLRPSDLEPSRVWASLDDNVHRAYERSMKFYESIRFVYELQSRLREWTDQQEEEDRAAAAGRPVEERRLPMAAAPGEGK